LHFADVTAVTGLAPVLLAHGLALNGVVFIVVALPAAWAVKAAGYTLFGRWLRPRYSEVEINPAVFGAFRALVGVCVGGVYYGLAYPDPTWWNRSPSPLPWYGVLTCLRLVEWIAVLWLFFGRHLGRAAVGRVIAHSAVGTAWSAALDGVVATVLVPVVVLAMAAA
jgi:hypothetical protein